MHRRPFDSYARKLVDGVLAMAVVGCGRVANAPPVPRVEHEAGTADAAPPGYPAGAIATLSADANDVLIFSPDPSVASPPWRVTSPALHAYDEVCDSVAFDRERRLYVLCTPLSRTSTLGHVFVFRSGATGDAEPMRTVSVPRGSSPDTLLVGFAVDDSARVYLLQGEFAEVDGGTACGSTGTVSVLPPGADGIAAPVAELTGNRTRMFCPVSIAVDAADRVYVSNGGVAVTVFRPGARGDADPERIIDPALNLETMTADRSGNVFVADWDNQVIFEYRAKGAGTTADRELSGPSTGIYLPNALAADEDGRVYVAASGLPDVTSFVGVSVFAPTASGDVSPERVLSDNVYGMSVAVAPRHEAAPLLP
jgi:hypothetical protein